VARPVTRFTDDELRGILAAATDANAAAPTRNDDFLDQFIAGVARSTGRLYGQPVYERLLGAAGIARRPSAQTWLKAIDRARALGTPAKPARFLPGPVATTAPPAVAMAPVAASARDALITSVSADELVEWKMRLAIAEATVKDAYARLGALERERAALIERATAAEAGARLAADQFERQRADHERQASALLTRIDALATSTDRLTGTERHLRLQTDAVRQEMAQQVQFFRSRVEVAEKALAQERTQTDAMRRVLGNREQSAK